MNAEQYLNDALGGNMNISTLKLLAWHEIMEGYAQHKLAEAQSQADNHRIVICPECGNSSSMRDLETLCQCGIAIGHQQTNCNIKPKLPTDEETQALIDGDCPRCGW